MVSSLVRPAANPFIEEFIRRAQRTPDPPWHPLLKGILDETHGIMTYQEDVTKVAMAVAGFSVEDADQLRKVISKEHKERQLRDYHAQFCEGAAKNGVPGSTITLLWKMIMSFAGYSFCKPHSASYYRFRYKPSRCEDTTALFDATVFPDTYRRFSHLLRPDRPYVLRGLVEEHFGVATLTIQTLDVLDNHLNLVSREPAYSHYVE